MRLFGVRLAAELCGPAVPWVPKNVWNWDPNPRYVDLEGESRMRREGFSQGLSQSRTVWQELGYRNYLNGK